MPYSMPCVSKRRNKLRYLVMTKSEFCHVKRIMSVIPPPAPAPYPPHSHNLAENWKHTLPAQGKVSTPASNRWCRQQAAAPRRRLRIIKTWSIPPTSRLLRLRHRPPYRRHHRHHHHHPLLPRRGLWRFPDGSER